MEFHLESIIFECKDYWEELLMTFGVDASANSHVCPSKFCKPCYAFMSRKVKASKEWLPYTHTVILSAGHHILLIAKSKKK